MNTSRPLMFALSLSGLVMAASPAMALDPAPCASDADCSSSMYCEFYDVSEPCASDEECPAPEGYCTRGGGASSCAVDADCPGSFTCQVVGASGCSAPPGSDATECVEQELRACVPPPPEACDPASASACSGDELCVTYTYESCSGNDTPVAPCEVDDEGEPNCATPPPAEDPTCESRTESYCVPPFLAPCEVDADCGLGFACKAQEVCQGSCAAPDCGPDDETCSSEPIDCSESCEPTGERSCQLIEAPCDSNADCSDGLSCVDVSEYLSGSRETSPEPDFDCGADDEQTGEPCDAPSPGEPGEPQQTNYCLPEGWERIFEYGGPGGSDGEGSGVSAPGQDDGWELVDSERAPQPSSPNLGDDVRDDGFCGGNSVAGSSAAPGLMGLMSLLGMMGWRRRRNR